MEDKRYIEVAGNSILCCDCEHKFNYPHASYNDKTQYIKVNKECVVMLDGVVKI